MKNVRPVPFILVILCIALSACVPERTESPNFVFILVDDLGWKDLGCYGSDFYETPNIDRLAAEGVLFTDAYAACPVCSPTRAAIMTGKYPSRLNITDWIPGDDPQNRTLLGPQDKHELPLKEVTIAEILKQEGYNTFFAGKWHLGDTGYFPEQQGFDINKGGHHRGSPPGGYYVPYKNPKLSDGPEGEHLTDRLTDESIRFIRNNKEDAFLLFLSFYSVHTPIQANHEYVDYYRSKYVAMGSPGQLRSPEHQAFTRQTQGDAAYASMVQAVDANVGKLLKVLGEEGLADNTVVFFTSDNGGLSTINHDSWLPPTAIKPLRAGKGWCYEGGIRVPLIIKSPVLKPKTIHSPVISMDFYPTIMDLAGIIPIKCEELDGTSLYSLLYQEDALDRDMLFWHYPHYHSSGWTPGAAIRMGNYKLIEFYELEKTELYDLINDPGETNNLADSLPDITDQLKAQLKAAQLETGAHFPMINRKAAGQ